MADLGWERERAIKHGLDVELHGGIHVGSGSNHWSMKEVAMLI